MAFQIGNTIGQYEFIDVLDSSKNGVTYKVRNTLADRFEALKVLPVSLQNDQDSVNRFLREMHVHARLIHPNIVTFFSAFPLGGQFVMTTELVEATTLADRLEAGRVPLPEALNYACQVLDALTHAHNHGVVHRDITPANILITPAGIVKLAGFALAKSPGDPNLTQAGVVLGSLHYMSPEQVKGIREVDARSDIYSAGVVLYEIVSGRRPFDFESQFDIMAAHVSQPPVPPLQHNRTISAELDHLILKALAKNPAERFQTAAEFRASLGTVLRIMPASSPMAPVGTPANGPQNWALPQQPAVQPALQQRHATMPPPVPVAAPSDGSVLPARQSTWNLAFVAASVLLLIAIVAFAITFLKS